VSPTCRSRTEHFEMTPLELSDGGKHWIARDVRLPAPVIAFSLRARDRGYEVGDRSMIYRHRIVSIDYTGEGNAGSTHDAGGRREPNIAVISGGLCVVMFRVRLLRRACMRSDRLRVELFGGGPESWISYQGRTMSLVSIWTVATRSRAPSDWRFWVLFAIAAVLLWIRDSWWKESRGHALRRTAKEIGFAWKGSISGLASGTVLLETGFVRRSRNAMIGQRAGCEVTLFDCEYKIRGVKSVDMHIQTVAAYRLSHVILPAFQFAPEHILREISTVGSTGHFKYETRLSGVRCGDGNYFLRSTLAEAGVLFNSEMLQSFNGIGLEGQSWLVEGNQQWLVICQPDDLMPPELYEQFLRQSGQIAANIFGYARIKHAAGA
jgi:hypothetical protein